MKPSLALALVLVPLGCAGTDPAPAAPQAPVASPVTVDLGQSPAATAEKKAPPPKPEPTAEAKAEGEGQEFGIIGILNTGAGGDPNAPTAPWGREDGSADDPATARGNMWGAAIGDSFGAGGLGLAGTGGGGGKGEGIGLGSIGSLGHGAGTGTGQGFGTGHGRLGGANRAKPPQIRVGAVAVAGRLPPEVIQRIVRQNFGRFRLCYENGLRNKPKLAGKVTVKFVIGRDGSVENVAAGTGAGETTMPDTGVTACVTRAFTGLSFPQPEGGKVTVVYPLTFKPAEDPPPAPPPAATSAPAPAAPAPAPAAGKR